MSTPEVSVVMPAYNAERHVVDAVATVLAQTLTDLELIVVDDGSTDATRERLASVDDPRVRVIEREHGGVVPAGNAALEHARGRYIARLDADDLMARDRLARQVAYLDAHPDCVACGTDYELFGERSGIVRMARTPSACRARLLFGSCIAHSTAMIRGSVLRAHGIAYRPEFVLSEDYGLFSELSHHGDLVNLPFVGARYRVHTRQATIEQVVLLREVSLRISRANLRARGIAPPEPGDLAAMVWLDRRGPVAAIDHLVRRAPRLVWLAARAGGRAGALSALRQVREQLNSALRI